MKKVYLLVVMMLGLGFTLSAIAQRTSYGEREKASQHTLNVRLGDVIYDQSEDEQYGGYMVSQFFTDEPSADLSCEGADDFVVPEGETWTVGSFGVWGTWWPDSPGNPEKVDIRIYSDNEGMPGDTLYSFLEQTVFYRQEWFVDEEHESYYNFAFPTPLAFSAGSYWISFRVHDSYDKVGQWGWQDKTNSKWEPWHWRNPNGGFLNGNFTTWSPSTAVTPFGYANDFRFALYGEAYDNDLAVLELVSPETGVLTANEAVTIKIKNEGKNTQTGFNVAFSLDGAAYVVENVGSFSLDQEEVAEFTFNATADLSETGFHTIVFKTMLTGDEQPMNDEMSVDMVNYGTIYPMVNNDTVDVTTCSGTFTDMGGVNGMITPGNNGVITFYPGEAGKKIKLNFFGPWGIYHPVGGVKPFRVFDGPDVNSPLLGEWTQNDFRDFGEKPGIIKALGETGAITIRYMRANYGDDVVGWTALVSCYDQPDDDFMVTEFSINPTLVFTDRDITLTATVQNIGNLPMSKEVTFYANDVAIGTATTPEVLPTEFATVSYTHQFTEAGDFVIKAAVPADGGDTPEDNFMTWETYIYQNGWFVEMFDDGYFPPEDWDPGNYWGGSSSAYSGTGAAQCGIPTLMKDTLTSPKLVIHEGDILTFYAATSLWWPGNLEIVYKDGESGEWHPIEYIDLGGSPQYKYYEVDVSAAAGENYLGFVDHADVLTSYSGTVILDHIIGIGIDYFYFDNDMKMIDFNPNPTPSKNTPIDYEVIVKNNGHNAMAAGDYTVKIMQVAEGGDIQMASVPGIACNHLQQKTHTLSVTFDKIGPAEVYAVVELAGDEKPENDQSINRPIYVQVNGTTIVEIGDGEFENSTIPNPLGTAWALSEVIYSSELINPTDETGFITGIGYEFNNTNTAPTLDVPVMIFVGETTKENLADGYINGSQLTKVVDTRVDLQRGLNQQLYIPFTAPYDYQGGNLCVMFFKPRETFFRSVQWLNTEVEDDSISAFSTSYNPPLDPYNMREASPNYKNLIPNTNFYIADVASVNLSGTVSDTLSMPLEDVTVEIVGFDNQTQTSANGTYLLENVLAWETVVKASKFGYYDNEQTKIIREFLPNVLNFELTLLPMVNVSATVVGNDDPMNFLEGAQVSLEGYENYTATVAPDGTFAIPGVYGDKSYELTISYTGFADYTATVEVADGDIDLGTLELDELLLSPFYTQAVQTNPGTVQVSWSSPLDGLTSLLSYDPEVNNGYAAEIGEEVWLGNVYEMEPGTINEVSLYWAQYGETSGNVRLDLIDTEGNVFYSSETFETVHDGWTTIDVPNITFEGGQFFAMAYWDGTNSELTDYLGADQRETGLGSNYAYIMYPGETPSLLSELLTGYDFTFQIELEIVNAAPESGRYNEGYNIFRGPYSDINNWTAWEKINSEPVIGNEYLDGTWPQAEEGYTYGVQTVYTTGVSEASFAIPIVHNPDLPCERPWNYIQTGLVHNISIPASADVNIFGESLTKGDWIGVFYLDDEGNEVCGGAGKWGGGIGSAGAVVNAYGDDPTTNEKDGFANGETFRWRLHDCSAWQEYPAGATYDLTKPNQGQFADFGLSAITVLEVMYCQYYSFSMGWNSLSSTIVPNNPDVVSMFAPLDEELTIIRNLSQVYWPEENLNTMGDFDNTSGYVLKVTEDVSFEVCGTGFASNEIAMENAGWYYLPVPVNCEVDAMDLFGDFMDDIVVVQELIGTKVFWPAMGVYSLETLMPGKAYKIKVSNPVTLSFPICDSRAVEPAYSTSNKMETPWGAVQMTPASQIVFFPAAALVNFIQGDIIAAFDQNNNVCGYMQIDGSANQSMILFADDPTSTVKDGYTDGENIMLRALRTESGEEFSVNVEWDYKLDNATGNFASESLSAIQSLTLGVTGIGNASASDVQMYPNPASDLVVITFNASEFNGAHITILDTKGNVVIETLVHESQTTLNISQLESGVYFVKIDAAQFNKVSKLIIN